MFQATPDSFARKIQRIIRRSFSLKKQTKSSTSNTPPSCQVLFINGCDLPTLRRYRVSHQREQLEFWGVSTDEAHYLQVSPHDADRAEVFIIYRCPWTDSIEQLIAAIHEQGKRIYFDVDDLVIDTFYTDNLPVVKTMTAQEKAVFDDGITRNGKTLCLCDGAIVTTERLQRELSKVLPDVFINRNVASREMVTYSEQARLKNLTHDPEKVILGYFSGSMTHNADFNTILPALAFVMEHRKHVHLKVVGELDIPPELQPFCDRIHTASYVPWQELPSLIATADINLAPLDGTIFNEAKSENKWIEASLVGVPTIASRVGAFDQVIESEKTGILCSGVEEWTNELLNLIDSPETRSSLGKQAHDYCLKHCVSERTGFYLAKFLLDIPQTIETMTPTEEESKTAWVQAYLSERAIVTSPFTFDSEPWSKVSLSQRIEAIQKARQSGKEVLLLIYERDCGDIGTFRYFGYNVAQRLKHSSRWFGTYLFVEELDDVSELIGSVSAIALVRCRIRPELLAIAKVAKEYNIPIAYLLDDNALGASRAPRIVQMMATDPNSSYEKKFWEGVTVRFQLASQLADCFLAPISYFAQILEKQEKKPAYVIHSSLNDEQVSIAKTIFENRRKTICQKYFDIGYFSGTSSHQEDFALVQSALIKFLSTHDDTRLVLCGQLAISDELAALMQQDKVIILPRVDYVTLQYLQAAVDVVLAPLKEDEFTNCKSALKVFEAGIVGTPACASSTSAYVEAIEPGKTGFICRNENDWFEAFEELYTNRARTYEMGSSAYEFALSHYYGDRICSEIEKACDALAVTAPTPIPPYVQTILETTSVKNWGDPFEVNPLFANKDTK